MNESVYELLKDRGMVDDNCVQTHKLLAALGMADGLAMILDENRDEMPAEEEQELLYRLFCLYLQEEEYDLALECAKMLFRFSSLKPAVNAGSAEEEKRQYLSGFSVTFGMLPKLYDELDQVQEGHEQGYALGYENGFRDGLLQEPGKSTEAEQ